MPESGTQNLAFHADEANCGNSNRYVLRGNHLPGNRSRSIGSSQQHRAEMEALSANVCFESARKKVWGNGRINN